MLIFIQKNNEMFLIFQKISWHLITFFQMASNCIFPSEKCLFILIALLLFQCPRQTIGTNQMSFNNTPSALSRMSEEKCETNKTFGFLTIALLLSCFVLNFSLQVLIYRSRELRSTKNLFLIALLVMNLFNCIIDMTLLIFRIFSWKYIQFIIF